MDEWNDKLFDQWIKLRENFRLAKKNKEYQRMIDIGKQIIKLDSKAKFIGITTELFENDITKATGKINNKH